VGTQRTRPSNYRVARTRVRAHSKRPRTPRTQAERVFDQLLAEDLEGRVQPFDQAAALAAGRIAARRQSTGRTVEIRDVQIAGIATVRKAVLATRNIRHFEDLGINLVDPWSASAA
jgi:predicted nucleic acid-binding protein